MLFELIVMFFSCISWFLCVNRADRLLSFIRSFIHNTHFVCFVCCFVSLNLCGKLDNAREEWQPYINMISMTYVYSNIYEWCSVQRCYDVDPKQFRRIIMRKCIESIVKIYERYRIDHTYTRTLARTHTRYHWDRENVIICFISLT